MVYTLETTSTIGGQLSDVDLATDNNGVIKLKDNPHGVHLFSSVEATDERDAAGNPVNIYTFSDFIQPSRGKIGDQVYTRLGTNSVGICISQATVSNWIIVDQFQTPVLAFKVNHDSVEVTPINFSARDLIDYHSRFKSGDKNTSGPGPFDEQLFLPLACKYPERLFASLVSKPEFLKKILGEELDELVSSFNDANALSYINFHLDRLVSAIYGYSALLEIDPVEVGMSFDVEAGVNANAPVSLLEHETRLANVLSSGMQTTKDSLVNIVQRHLDVRSPVISR